MASIYPRSMDADRIQSSQARSAIRPSYSALSYSSAIKPLLASCQTWHVLSMHRHACNLRNTNGDLVALVSPYHGDGPFHLVLPETSFCQQAVHDEVQTTQERLCWGKTMIDLQSAQCWEPVVQWPHSPLSLVALSVALDKASMASSSWFSSQTSAPAAFIERTDRAKEALLTGVRHCELSQLQLAAQLLAGLGPGLTPAGDDFLLGWMAGVYLCAACCTRHFSAHACCTQVAATARCKTTQLSATWIDYAAKGAFGAPWHELAHSLQTAADTQIIRALQQITGWGASSGYDALAGLRWAMICYGY